jgi:CPA1 family monovalent cation:H+ antiporter
VLRFDPSFAGLAAAGIPLVLLGRFLAVTGPVLTWGGLRGGILIALALSLPEVAKSHR